MAETELSIQKMDPGELAFAFALEDGPVCEYPAWKRMVTCPDWMLLSIYRGDYMKGWVGMQRIAPRIAQYHISLVRRALAPAETRQVVLEIGRFLFDQGFDELRAVMLISNKAARRLAECSGMWVDCLEIKNQLPHVRYIMTKEVFYSKPRGDVSYGN